MALAGLSSNQFLSSTQTVLTNAICDIFGPIPKIAKVLKGIKKGESINFDKFSSKVTSKGESSNFLEDVEKLKRL